MEKVKNTKIIVTIFALLVLLDMAVCVFLYFHEMRVTEIDTAVFQKLGADEIGYAIDENSITTSTDENCAVTVRGWVIIRGKATTNVAIHCLVSDIQTGITYKLPTAIQSRPDVTAAMNDGTNYDNSGIFVSMNRWVPFEPDEQRYQISFLYQLDDVEYLIPTHVFLGGSNDK